MCYDVKGRAYTVNAKSNADVSGQRLAGSGLTRGASNSVDHSSEAKELPCSGL